MYFFVKLARLRKLTSVSGKQKNLIRPLIAEKLIVKEVCLYRMNNIAKGERVRFNIFDDLLLLREVIAVNPYENDSRWKDIRLSLNNASNKNFSLRALKEHVQHLLQLLNKEDSANLRK